MAFDKAVRLVGAKINEWLSGVERQMQMSLATQLQNAVHKAVAGGSELREREFLEWSQQFPTQIVLLAASICGPPRLKRHCSHGS